MVKLSKKAFNLNYLVHSKQYLDVINQDKTNKNKWTHS